MSSDVSSDACWLVGDVGSTNARFGLVAAGDRSAALRDVASLRCADYPGLAAAVEAYLARVPEPRPRVAAIAIAAPPTGDRLSLTNHPWTFSISETRQVLGLDRLDILNDFTALALSLPVLPMEDLVKVGEGSPTADAPLAVIGPGTGLGVSGLIKTGDRWMALTGEGGHAAFSPVTEREMDVARMLKRRYGHVSWERLLSGPGLVNLYESLAELTGQAPEPLSPRDVSKRGMERSCPICGEALDMFCGTLGTAAGNLALTLGARGGVYIGGGIVPKLGDFFQRSAFRQRFEEKGRFADYLAAIPTYVISARYPALIGSAIALLAPAVSA
jgi:glucokinase